MGLWLIFCIIRVFFLGCISRTKRFVLFSVFLISWFPFYLSENSQYSNILVLHTGQLVVDQDYSVRNAVIILRISATDLFLFLTLVCPDLLMDLSFLGMYFPANKKPKFHFITATSSLSIMSSYLNTQLLSETTEKIK